MPKYASSPKLDPKVEAFFSPFDQSERLAIEGFAKRVEASAARADVVVVIARRAWCLLAVLKLLRRFKTDRPMISDRTLDWGSDQIAGKDVLLVDDCIVTGKVLRNARLALERAKSVRMEVLAYNREKLDPANVEPPTGCLALSTQAMSELCSNIVDGFSLVPIPYSTDFPLYTNPPIKSDQLFELLHAPEFEVHDLSTGEQVRNHVFNYSLLPRIPLRARIEERTGLKLGSEALVKIRLLGRRPASPGETLWSVLAPMVVLPALEAEQIDTALQWHVQRLQTPEAKASVQRLLKCRDPRCYRAKFRLLGAILAADFTRLTSEVFEQNYGIPLRQAKVTGTEHLIDVGATGLFQLDPRLAVTTPASAPPPIVVPVTAPTAEIPAKLPVDASLFDALMGQFSALYESQEKAAKADLFTTESAKSVRRGLSLSDLRAAVAGFADRGVDIAASLSVFLDDTVDRGFVVPETIWTEHPPAVARVYRYGENLLFNQEDQVILACMLREFFGATPGVTPKSTDMHKILSLLLRFGHRIGLFRSCTPELAHKEREWISRKFWLHGVVPAVTTGRGVVIGKADVPLLKRLVHDSYLVRKGTDGFGLGNRKPNLQHFDEARSDEAIVVGSLIGDVYARYARKRMQARAKQEKQLQKDKKPPRKEENELVLLSTCLDANDTAAAMAAEAEYIVEKWGAKPEPAYEGDTVYTLPELLENALQIYRREGGMPLFKAEETKLETALRAIKIPLHSALWKYRSFTNGKCEKIARRCEQSLKTRDRALWRKLIGSYRAYAENWQSTLLGTHLHRSATFFARLGFLWAELELTMQIMGGRISTAGVLALAKVHSQESTDQLWLNFDEAQYEEDETSEATTTTDDIVRKCLRWMTLFARLHEHSSDSDRHLLTDWLQHLPRTIQDPAANYGRLVRDAQELIKEEAWEIVWVANELYRDTEDAARVQRHTECLVVDFTATESAPLEAYNHLITHHLIPYNRAHPTAKIIPLARDNWTIPGQAVFVPVADGESNTLVAFIEYVLANLSRWPSTLGFTLITDLPLRYSIYVGGRSSQIGCGPLVKLMSTADSLGGNTPAGAICILSASSSGVSRLQLSTGLQRLRLETGPTRLDLTRELRQLSTLDWTESVYFLPPERPPSLRFLPQVATRSVSLLGQQPAERVPIAIITVVPTESAAVSEVFGENTTSVRIDRGRAWDGPFLVHDFLLSNGVMTKVVQHPCVGEGPDEVAAAFTRLVDEFQPEIFLLVGVAGVNNTQVRAGDVVVGLNTFPPNTSQQLAEPKNAEPPQTWTESVGRMLQSYKQLFQTEAAGKWGSRVARAFYGIVGAKPQKSKAPASEVLNLAPHGDSAQLTESESAAFAQAFLAHSARRVGAPRGWLIVRGITDGTNRKRNDGIRRTAALNAATVAKQHLSCLRSVDLPTISKS